MKLPNLLGRVLVAVLLVLPSTLLFMAATWRSELRGPLVVRFITLVEFFLVAGPAFAIVFVLLHVVLEKLLSPKGLLASVAVGALVGCLVVVPLVFGLQRLIWIVYGAFGGGLYALLVQLLFSPRITARKAT